MISSDYDNESSGINTRQIQRSVLSSDSERLRKVPGRERFLSSVRNIRNASNQSIRDLAETDRNNSSIVAGYNVTNLIQGIGILGVPFAIVKGGWIGAAMVLVVAFIACSTGKMLVECLYDTSHLSGSSRVRRTYSSIGAEVWPRFGGLIVNTFTFIEMFGGTTLYIILMSVESHNFIGKFTTDFSIYYCSLILTIASLPLTFITRMSIVSWFSFIAVLGLFGTITTIIIYCLYNIDLISLSHFPGISWQTLPLSLGIITFSYCAHAAFPGIESCMKYPTSFNMMMNVSFILAAIVKFSMAFLFVLIFGTNTYQQCSINVINPYFSGVLEIFIILNTFFSIPLTTFIISEQIDDNFQPYFHQNLRPGGRYYWFWLVLTRTFLLTASMFTAMMVPHFALMMGLVGSITGSCLTFIFPCIFSLTLKAYELSSLGKIYRVCLIILGVILGITGTVVSMMEIIDTFK